MGVFSSTPAAASKSKSASPSTSENITNDAQSATDTNNNNKNNDNGHNLSSSSSPPSLLPVPNATQSFWHSQPSAFLLDHRTTADLPEDADVVIVGSGITGAAIARYLSEGLEDGKVKGKRVVMLEAREACWGATGRNGGHCQPLLFDRSPSVGAFELKNVAAVKSYIDTHNIPCEWRTVSGCRTFWSEALMQEAEREIAEFQKAVPKLANQVQAVRDKEELATKWRVSRDCVGASITAGAGSLWPYKYVSFMLEKSIKEHGLNLQTNTPVTSIEISSSSDSSMGKEDGNSDGYTLHTPRGSIKTPTIFLATNGYTAHLIPSFKDLIVPCRGQMSALLPPRGSDMLPASYGFVGALGQPANNDDYLIQRPFASSTSSAEVDGKSGHLMFGGGRGKASMPSLDIVDDSVIDPDVAIYLRSALLKVLDLHGDSKDDTLSTTAAAGGGNQQQLEATHEWTGIMGFSRDNHPWVGKLPSSAFPLPSSTSSSSSSSESPPPGTGIFLCAGYTGHGMPNGTLCAKAVVEMYLAELLHQQQQQQHTIATTATTTRAEAETATAAKLIQAGDLPAEYLISTKRIQRAKELWPSVHVIDEQGLMGGLEDGGFYKLGESGRVIWDGKV